MHYDECAMSELSSEEQLLLQAAMDATTQSYSPYSHFRVGAAVLLCSGQIITGSNQENSAFPVTLCAERVALFSACHQHSDAPVSAIALAAQDANGFTVRPVTPCLWKLSPSPCRGGAAFSSSDNHSDVWRFWNMENCGCC